MPTAIAAPGAPAAPGVYFEQADRGRSAAGPLRTDIAGFVGYAGRGPLLAPVKITNGRQFTAVFGELLSFAHLGYAVRGFFDNGGAVCYVVRIADRSPARGAAAAAVAVRDVSGAGDSLLLWASHGVLLDPVTQKQQTSENGAAVRYTSPGAWGNRLAISLFPAGLGSTATRPDMEPAPAGRVSTLESLSGFQVGSIVQLSQGGTIAGAYRSITAIDPQRQAVTWDADIAATGFDLSQPVRVESVEFTLLILLDGQVAEHYANLSLSARHSRYIVSILQAESRLLDASVSVAGNALLDPGRWPVPVERLALSGGRDGLAGITKNDFLAGLDALAEVDEVSILAAPDAVLQLVTPAAVRTPQQRTSCDDLDPPVGRLAGRVVERTDAGDAALHGVTVTPANTAASSVVTDAAGHFTLINLPVGLVSLRLEKDGYLPLDTTSEARSLTAAAAPARFELSPISLPPSLPADDIFDIQAAMLRQGERGLYRVALLDPPADMLSLDAIQTWRARFDSSFAALYHPWLMVEIAAVGGSAASDLRATPPSGHVAGVIARTDLAFGVHRAPANYVLDGVKALSQEIDDSQQAILNPLGINCLRVLPGRGIRVFGARTLSSDPEFRYLNVRRLLLMIEEAIEDSHQWAVFEPNNPILRQALSFSLNSFLDGLWRGGALAGNTPAAAYTVQCNDVTTPQALSEAGQVVAEIGVAPVVPFEFITFRLGRTVEAIEVKE
jgi:uncharacterized protein